MNEASRSDRRLPTIESVVPLLEDHSGWFEEAQLPRALAFPHDAVLDALETPTFERLQSAVSALNAWWGRIEGTTAFEEFRSEPGWVPDIPADVLPAGDLRTWLLPAYLDCGDGSVMQVPEGVHERLSEKFGMQSFHNLGEAALHGDVRVSVFARRIQVEPLYDGPAAMGVLERGGSVADLDPIGERAAYRVEILDGELQQPPLWPADAMRRAENDFEEGMSP